MTRSRLGACFLILGLFTTAVRAEENAAIQYWQAFAMMPEKTPARSKLLDDDWLVHKDDPVAAELYKASGSALRALMRGGRIPACDWGLPYQEEGAMTFSPPHLPKSRQLYWLVNFAIAYEIEQGRTPQAVDHFLAGMTMARQVGNGGITINVLVSMAEETGLEISLASRLPRLHADDLHRITVGLASLPPATPMKEAILTEKRFTYDRMIARLKDKNTSLEDFTENFDGFYGPTTQPGADREQRPREILLALFHQAEPFYERCAQLTDVPAGEFEARARELVREGDATKNIMVLLPVGSLVAAVRVEKRASAMRAMLMAAITRQLEGDGAFAKLKDPFGDGPFTITPFPNGYELQSRIKRDGEPMTLDVGFKKQPVAVTYPATRPGDMTLEEVFGLKRAQRPTTPAGHDGAK